MKYSKTVIGTSTAGYAAENVDYLCDGTNDNTIFTNALKAGGEIVLLDGTYNLSPLIEITTPVQLEGCGDSTIINYVKNTSITEGNIFKISGNNCSIKDIRFVNTTMRSAGAFSITGSNITVEDCSFEDYSLPFAIGEETNGSCKNIIITGNRANTTPSLIASTMEFILTNLFVDNAIISNNIIDSISNTFDCLLGTVPSGKDGNKVIITNNIAYSLTDKASYVTVGGENAVFEVSNNILLNGSISSNWTNSNIASNIAYNFRNRGIAAAGEATLSSNIAMRGTGQTSDYTSSQQTIELLNIGEFANLNLILGKDIKNDGIVNSVINNKYN